MYGRGQQPGFRIGPPITPLIVKQLLIANAAVYLLQRITYDASIGTSLVAAYGSIIPVAVWEHGYIWQPFTYMWLHSEYGFGHLLMNMFTLWMFGSQVALAWGPKRFFRFYMICGVGAGLIIATYPYIIQMFDPTGVGARTLGASGAVYGVLLAYSLTWPDRTIMLIFPPVAFRAIWLIPGLFLMSMMFDGGGNVSHIGHLGGVVVAWFYLRREGATGSILSLKQIQYRWRRYRMRQKLRAVRYEEFEARREEEENRRKYH